MNLKKLLNIEIKLNNLEKNFSLDKPHGLIAETT